MLGGGDEVTGSATVDQLEELIANGATIVDVRDKGERDEGYIPGSRNVPYRLMRTCCPDLPKRPADRHGLQHRDAGGDRGEHPEGEGHDARPVVDGGMDDWLARGETTVSFRRCGS